MEISRSAERDHRCRWTPPPFEKGGRKLYYGARKLYYGAKKLFMGENFCATSKILTAVKSDSAKTKALPLLQRQRFPFTVSVLLRIFSGSVPFLF